MSNRRRGATTTHAIIRGGSGRRHEVDFGDKPVKVEVFLGEETVDIAIEAERHDGPSGKQPFALLHVSRSAFDRALAEAVRRPPPGARAPSRPKIVE